MRLRTSWKAVNRKNAYGLWTQIVWLMSDRIDVRYTWIHYVSVCLSVLLATLLTHMHCATGCTCVIFYAETPPRHRRRRTFRYVSTIAWSACMSALLPGLMMMSALLSGLKISYVSTLPGVHKCWHFCLGWWWCLLFCLVRSCFRHFCLGWLCSMSALFSGLNAMSARLRCYWVGMLCWWLGMLHYTELLWMYCTMLLVQYSWSTFRSSVHLAVQWVHSEVKSRTCDSMLCGWRAFHKVHIDLVCLIMRSARVEITSRMWFQFSGSCLLILTVCKFNRTFRYRCHCRGKESGRRSGTVRHGDDQWCVLSPVDTRDKLHLYFGLYIVLDYTVRSFMRQ